MNKKIGIFVPARLGSHRLPNKQILPIGDTCMFDICCQKLQYISVAYGIPTYVLICDEPLIEIANKYPNVVIKHREKATVEAEGPLQFIYKDVLDVPEDYLVFLNPCLIFLSCETIMAKIMEFDESPMEYGTTVKQFKNWLWDDEINAVNYIDYKRLTTKEITPWYQCAHCFHVFNKNKFIEDGYMLKEDLCLLEIPAEETIDIDEQHEYEFAKWKWEKEH
jgi:CMP-N-acetylneuraminic acid synthetase